MPTLRDYELAFQQDPAQMEAFLALRKAYREAGKWDRLVVLYETRAQALTSDGAKAAELFYLAAEVRTAQLNDEAGAEADLVHALDRDPGNAKAAQRLKLIYRQQGRTADYLTMLEMEAAAVAKAKDPARTTELQNEMNQLFSSHFTRLEKAISGPHRAQDVTPDMLKTVESARKIYRALADWPNVVRLYDLEIAGTSDGKRRADLLLALGKVHAEKTGQLDAAADKLNEVIKLRPRDEKALELLAAVYASPSSTGEGRDRAASYYHQIARRKSEAGDADGAIALLRKAIAVVPGHAESSELIERILYGAGRLKDLDRYYRERVAEARSIEEKMDFLFKRAQLAERDLNDRGEALRVYEEIVAIEPPGGPAAQHLAELYTASHNYGKLAELREKQLEAITDPAVRLPLLRELAALSRDRLGDPDQAAVYLHAILQIAPGDDEALAAYADHFRTRGDFGSLVDLLEFSVEHAHAQGSAPEVLVPKLEEVATLAERNLADTDRALAAWARIEQLAPTYERAREAQKRILQKTRQWDRMASLVEREAAAAAAAQDRGAQLEAQKRLARLYIEKVGDAGRAAAVYRDILAADPHDNVAMRALVELYEREENWPALAALLREQLGNASKQERAALLRRLVGLYEERIADLPQAAWAAEELLALVPGERESMARLEAILERAGDKPRLADTLERHLAYAAAEERPALLRRLALLVQSELGDVARATGFWEDLARLVPGDRRALDALAGAYDALGRPQDLARILDRQIEQASGDPAAQADALRRLAHLAGGPLADAARALAAWEALLRLLPSDVEALEALSSGYAAVERWPALADVLERRIAITTDASVAAALALDRARLVEEKLGDPAGAIAALERLVTELDPRNAEAHARLRRLAEAMGDWPRVVQIADRALPLVDDPMRRLAAAFEVGVLIRDRLADLPRAIAAFERVAALAPDHLETLQALAPLYAAAGESEKLVATDEKLLGTPAATDPGVRRRLMFEIADTYEEALGEARRAFEWTRRAYAEFGDDEVLARLERLAEAHALWEELIRVHEARAAGAREPADALALARRIAQIAEVNLRDPRRAFAVLRDALPSDPAGAQLLPELERLAEVVGDHPALLDVYARVARGRPSTEDRVALLERRAVVREQKLHDASGALDEYLRSFALMPDHEGTQLQILRLAEATGRWEDALGVQAQLFARAGDVASKIEIAKEAASLVEEKVRDRVRAFRAYLNAFRLAPEDEDIVANLWRLAKQIGRYTATPGTPAPPGERTVELDVAALVRMQQAVQAPSKPASGKGEGTVELDLATLQSMQRAASAPDDGDETELELDELEEADEDAVAAAPTTPPPRPTAPPPAPARAPGATGFDTPWEELAHAYGLLPANDNATRHRYLLKIAEIWEVGANDVGRAFDALERAFRLDPNDATVRNDLTRMAERHGEWDRVCAIYLGAIDAGTSREQAIALHHEVAAFREALGQVDAAEERYRAIVQLQSDDRRALQRLEEIYRSQERWAELAAILDRRTSGMLEQLPPGMERRKRLLELAGLYDRRLDRPYEATDLYERFVAELADDERGPDAPDVVVECRTALDALARMYSAVERWPKVAETLARAIELGTAGDPAATRALRMRLATVQERELVQPAQAIATYEAILAQAPDDAEALAALERLLEKEGRFESLEEVLGRRAERATGDERLELVRRRARILEERLGNPDAAASALRGLAAEGIQHADVVDALLRNLRSAGLPHEAARVLAQRAELLEKRKAPATELASLYLAIARLRSEDLGDLDGAREAIEAALEQTPDSPEALTLLASLHLKANAFAQYAKVKQRQAKALGATPEAAACWVEAGRVYRDQLGDPAQAKKCFGKALAAHAEDDEALRSLASLLTAEGDVAGARELLQRQLDSAQTPAARAVVLTDLARTLWEKPGDAPAVLPYLDEALDLVPDHVPALVTMADVLEREGQWAEAERRLAPLVRKLRGGGDAGATLHVRLAEIYDKLGRLDDGYKQLQEADRMAPGRIAVRLALGTNRIAARKWREAAAALEGIALLPEAASRADEVAQGLFLAGQAEQKLKSLDRAAACWNEALRLAPAHVASLRALAELAMERGETREAIALLRRVVEATTDVADKVRLLERLGDRLDDAGELAEARAAFEQAVALVTTPSADHVPLLEKTLELQRAAGARRQASETAARLITLEVDPKVRAERRRETAGGLLDEGDPEPARELLLLALADDPSSEATLVRLVEACDASGDTKGLADALAGALPGLPAPTAKTDARARRAALWRKLAELRQADGETEAARQAFERVVDVDPEDVAARRALAEVYSRRPEARVLALANHRALVNADMTAADSLRALARVHVDEGRLDCARCCVDVLVALGLANDDDAAFGAAHPQPPLRPDDPYPNILDDPQRAQHLAHPEAAVMGEVFATIWEGVPELAGPTLESFGVAAADKVSPISDQDVAKIYAQVAKALGNQRASFYLNWDPAFTDVGIAVTRPPSIVAPGSLADAAWTEVRFRLGRALELARPELILAATVRTREFTALFGSIVKAFHPRHARRRAGDAAAEQAAKLKKTLPYKVAKRLGELFQAMGSTPFSSARWRQVALETGNRAGLLVCGDLSMAARIVAGDELGKSPAFVTPAELREQVRKQGPLRELFRFAISEDYFALRGALGTAIAKAA